MVSQCSSSSHKDDLYALGSSLTRISLPIRGKSRITRLLGHVTTVHCEARLGYAWSGDNLTIFFSSSLFFFWIFWLIPLLFLISNYSNDVLPKRNYFGYRDGPDNSAWFRFKESVSIFTPDGSKGHIERLSEDSLITLWELATDT